MKTEKSYSDELHQRLIAMVLPTYRIERIPYYGGTVSQEEARIAYGRPFLNHNCRVTQRLIERRKERTDG